MYASTTVHTAVYASTKVHTAVYASTKVHTVVYANTKVHTAVYASAKVHTAVYTSTKVHTSMYASSLILPRISLFCLVREVVIDDSADQCQLLEQRLMLERRELKGEDESEADVDEAVDEGESEASYSGSDDSLHKQGNGNCLLIICYLASRTDNN